MESSFWIVPVVALTLLFTAGPVCLAEGDGVGTPELQKGELLFIDDFQTTKVGGSWGCVRGENQSNYYDDGKYIINVAPADSWWRVSSGKSFGDSIVEVEATPISGPDDNVYGVMAGWLNWSNYYLFLISGDGYYKFTKREGGAWIQNDPWTKSDAINLGKAMNLIQVKRQGETLSFCANGKKMADYVDDSFPEGKVGIIAGTTACGGGDVTVSFDNFSVWNIEGS